MAESGRLGDVAPPLREYCGYRAAVRTLDITMEPDKPTRMDELLPIVWYSGRTGVEEWRALCQGIPSWWVSGSEEEPRGSTLKRSSQPLQIGRDHDESRPDNLNQVSSDFLANDGQVYKKGWRGHTGSLKYHKLWVVELLESGALPQIPPHPRDQSFGSSRNPQIREN